MTLTLACTHAELFAAAASVIANFTETMMAACKPSRSIPLLMMNGTADPLIAYGGGRGTSRYAVPNVVSTAGTIAFWRKNNGCAAADRQSTRLSDKDTEDSSTVTRVDSDCPDGRDVVLYRIDGGGHRMPGRFPMRASCASSTPCSARRTTTSTAPRRSGRSSGSFRDSFGETASRGRGKPVGRGSPAWNHLPMCANRTSSQRRSAFLTVIRFLSKVNCSDMPSIRASTIALA